MGLRIPKRLSAALACGVIAAVAPPAARAQGAVRSVALEAEVDPTDAAARVRVRYELAVSAGEVVVPFELLGFGEATADGFVVQGTPGAVALAPVSGSRRTARVALAGEAVGTRVVEAAYRVAGAVRREDGAVRVEIPVLSVAWPPETSLPGHFTAQVRVPPGWRIVEGFPSGLTPSEEPGAAGAYVVDLSVTPSVVSLRGRDDGAWRPGLPLVLDTLVLLAVLGCGWLGWLHLRGVAARAAAEPA